MHHSSLRVYLPSSSDCPLVTTDDQILAKFAQHNFANERAIRVSSPEEADLILIFQTWSFKLPEYINLLNNSVLVRKFSEKLFVINYDDTVGEGFLPGCYTSLQLSTIDRKRFVPSPYPKVYNEQIDPKVESNQTPKYLFSFRGTSESHKIRETMIKALEHTENANIIDVSKTFHSHSVEDKQTFSQEIQDSVFVLCPRGCSPNSYRIFETMSLGRCPVIIADEWVETVGPDWSKCSIRVAEKDIHLIPKLLDGAKNRGIEMGQNARAEWLKHFSESAKYQGYFDQIVKLYETTPAATMSFEEYSRYWRSHEFLRKNGWSLAQKIVRRLSFINRK